MAQANLADTAISRRTVDLTLRSTVPPFFWPAAATTACVAAVTPNLNSDIVTTVAIWLMLIGGLPHGAYDIATGRRALMLDSARAILLLIAYISIALSMAAIWLISPGLALSIFLLSAAIHFGEDWQNLDTGLLRATAGASVICVPAIFQPEEVAQLFVVMGGAQGEMVSRIAIACAPVAILVMLTALARAFLQSDREWAFAHAASFIGLALLPPALGFTLFFVFLHSPLHMREVHRCLPDWTPVRLASYGMAFCGLGLLGGMAFFGELLSDTPSEALASGFKILSILAAPHLLMHSFKARYLKTQKP